MLSTLAFVGVLSFLRVFLALSSFPANEYYALEDFYNSLHGENWSWNLSKPILVDDDIVNIQGLNMNDGTVWNFTGFHNPCLENWQGINCTCLLEACTITSIELANYNLSGTLPESISNFTNLVSLYLNYNLIVGRIPDSISSLRRLVLLSLGYNSLSSSIPLSLGNCTQLEHLHLESNIMTGTIPEVFYQLSNLSLLNLANNTFRGELSPSIGLLSNLRHLFLSNNDFEGEVPSEIGNCTHMLELYFDNNSFHGAIPQAFENMTHLNYLDLYLNDFTGSLPDWIGERLRLLYLDVGTNYLTGTIPASLCTKSSVLVGLLLNENLLSGTIPDCLAGNASTIAELVLDINILSGTLSTEYSLSRHLKSFIVSNNNLHGVLPSFQASVMQVVFVQGNQLTGNLYNVFNASSMRNVQFVDFSDNAFTGSIPDSFYHLHNMRSFALVSNCISGSISSEICNWKDLQYLDMDGLHTAKQCQEPILPPLFTSYVIGRSIGGSIPPCLFELKSLESIHLSGNAIDCSLPSNLEISDSLQDITLSHNTIRGVIPLSMQTRKFTTLDLSFNCFTGGLHPDFNVSVETRVQVNRLSGAIPEAFKYSHNINILDGNLFTCDLDRHALPHHDPKRSSYQCGSNAFDSSLIVWFIIICPVGMVLLIGWRAKKHFSSENSIIKSIRRWYIHYESSLNVFYPDPNVEHQSSLVEFALYMVRLRTTFFRLTLIVCVVLMPMYILLSHFYATHTHQYSWNASALYLSGETPALILMIAFLGLLLIIFISVRSFLWRWLKKEVFVDQDTSINSQVTKVAFNFRRLMVLALVALINCSFMLVLNGVYVFFVFETSTGVVFLCQIVISLFKLGWNEYALTWMVSYSKIKSSAVVRPLSLRMSRGSQNSVNNSNQGSLASLEIAEQKDFQKEEDVTVMPVLTFIVIFNSIIAPVIANAILSQQCYQGVFIHPDRVSSESSYEVCHQQHTFLLTNVYCPTSSKEYLMTTYDPPFIYRFGCSSSFINHYASVYVYMFLLSGIKPSVFILLKNIYDRTKSMWWKRMTSYFLNILLKEDLFDLNRIRTTETLFRKERFVLNNVSATVVLMTVGVVFPPIAVVVLFAIYTHTFYNLFLIGRFVNHFEGIQRELIVQILNKDCEGVAALFKYSSLITLPFISCFYAIFVLGIYGDDKSLGAAICTAIVVFIVPLFGFPVYQLYRLMLGVSQRQKERSDAREKIGRARSMSVADVMLRGSYFRWRSTVSHAEDVHKITVVNVENPIVKSVELVEKSSAD